MEEKLGIEVAQEEKMVEMEVEGFLEEYSRSKSRDRDEECTACKCEVCIKKEKKVDELCVNLCEKDEIRIRNRKKE